MGLAAVGARTARGVLVSLLSIAPVLTSLAADVAAHESRVEARSADLLAVGTVQADRMVIHLSRVADNAPLHDAAVNVVLRGATYPTTAQADGSFLLEAPDLELPGAAAVEFQVVQAAASESLQGTLQSGAAAQPMQEAERSSSRQLWWWALNFGVCIGFLWLWSRRKKPGEDEA